MKESFSDINKYLKERLIHSSRYTEGQFSFLKIYQHALKYSQTERNDRLIRNYFRFPFAVQSSIHTIKSWYRNRNKKIPTLKEYVFLDHGRAIRGNRDEWHSMYFDKIGKLIGKERLSTLCEASSSRVQYDVIIDGLKFWLPRLDDKEEQLLRELNGSLKKAVHSKQFTKTELRHLRSQMHLFFEGFRFYYNLLKDQRVKHFIVVCHYQREGAIAALKILGINCTELQHGLIANNDVYYVYDEQFSEVMKKAMMPDRIIVYGSYWKKILEGGCEYRSRNIHVGGDYLYRLEGTELTKPQQENIVLICTQTGHTPDYLEYSHRLLEYLKKHSGWKVIIKLHPSQQDKQAYDELLQYGTEIIANQIPLDTLLAKAKIHITIYSTTLYDALGFDIMNFSLQNFSTSSDYAHDMITERVAFPLSIEEDPIEKYNQIISQPDYESMLLKREDVYSEFKPEVFKKLLDL